MLYSIEVVSILKRLERISIFLPHLHGGGAERVAVNLANSFVERGYAVDMVLLSASGQLVDDLRPEVRVVDLQVQRMRGALPPLVRYLRRVRPKAVLANMWPLTIVAILAKLLAQVESVLVVVEHATWSTSGILSSWYRSRAARWSMRMLFPLADGVVAVSRGAADDLATFASLSRQRIDVVHNPVVAAVPSTVEVPALALEAWSAGEHRKVLAVGTLKPIKDYPLLLRAFAILVQTVDAKLLILGDGESRAALETLSKQLGISDRVFMPGFQKNLAPYYAAADVHVLSSLSEGFGNVIVEALAVGTPVVATDCASGPREILAGGQFGRLVPVGDASRLASALAESLSLTHDPLSLIARAQDFSIEKAVDKYEQILFGHQTGRR